MLASTYTSMARREPASIGQHIKLLEGIKERIAHITAEDGHHNLFLDHSLARLCHIAGNSQASRRHIRSSISSGIALLTDKVEYKDWQGCLVLIDAMKAVEDDKHAMTACGVLYKLTEPEEGSSQFRFNCDGNCHRSWPDGMQCIFICRDCADVQFGSCCYHDRQKVIRSNLVCGDKHTFFEFSEEDATNSMTSGQDLVWHDGKEMDKKTWIEKLRKQYL